MIGDEHFRASGTQRLHQVISDLARALHGEARAAQVGMTELEFQACANAMQRAQRSEARRIAAAADQLRHADDMASFLADQFHVFGVGAHIFGSDVASAERLNEAAERAKQRFALIRFGIADQHALGAAEIQAGDRGFVRHVGGVLQHVADRIRFVRVRPHAQAAERRAQYGAVNRDHAAQAAFAMMEEHHLLVTEPAHSFEQIHRRPSSPDD